MAEPFGVWADHYILNSIVFSSKIGLEQPSASLSCVSTPPPVHSAGVSMGINRGGVIKMTELSPTARLEVNGAADYVTGVHVWFPVNHAVVRFNTRNPKSGYTHQLTQQRTRTSKSGSPAHTTTHPRLIHGGPGVSAGLRRLQGLPRHQRRQPVRVLQRRMQRRRSLGGVAAEVQGKASVFGRMTAEVQGKALSRSELVAPGVRV